MSPGPSVAPPDAPSVCVAVCTAGHPQRLALCLGAVIGQHCDPAAFEIVVVDFGPGDDAAQVVSTLAPCGGAPRVRYVRGDGGGDGLEAARRCAERSARAPRIVVIDDAAQPEPGWLAEQATPPLTAPVATPRGVAAAR